MTVGTYVQQFAQPLHSLFHALLAAMIGIVSTQAEKTQHHNNTTDKVC